MKYRISTPNERVWCTTQLAKLSFNHSIGRTHSWRFSFFFIKNYSYDYAATKIPHNIQIVPPQRKGQGKSTPFRGKLLGFSVGSCSQFLTGRWLGIEDYAMYGVLTWSTPCVVCGVCQFEVRETLCSNVGRGSIGDETVVERRCVCELALWKLLVALSCSSLVMSMSMFHMADRWSISTWSRSFREYIYIYIKYI